MTVSFVPGLFTRVRFVLLTGCWGKKIPEVTREDPSLVWNMGFWGVFILKNIPIFLAFVGRFSLVGKS